MLKVYLNPAAQFLRVFWKLSVFVKFPLPELFVENSNRMQVLHHIYLAILLKSVSMRKPGRTRQGVIMPKSPISLKLGTNVRYQECQVKILNSWEIQASPVKILPVLYIIN